MIGKIVSALIFVALGTGALAYSIHHLKRGDSEAVAAEASDAPAGEEAEDKIPQLRLQPVASDGSQATMLPGSATQAGGAKPLATKADQSFAPPTVSTGFGVAVDKENRFGGQEKGPVDPPDSSRLTMQRPTTGPPTPKSFSTPAAMSSGAGSVAKQDQGLTPPVTNSFGGDDSSGKSNARPEVANRSLEKSPSVTPEKSPLPNTGMLGGTGPARIVPAFGSHNQPKSDSADRASNPDKTASTPSGASLNSPGNSSFSAVNSPPQGRVSQAAGPVVDSAPTATLGPAGTSPPLNPLTQTPASRSSMAAPPSVSAGRFDRPTGSGLRTAGPPTATRGSTQMQQAPDVPIRNRPGNAEPFSPVSFGRLTKPTPGERKLEGVQTPALTIEKIAPAEIQVNQPADFQLVVRNVGRITANGVRVVDQIPAGTELIQAVPQPSKGPDNRLSWELDSLKPGQEKRIKIKLRPLRPGEIGSVAEVSFAAQASMRTKVTKPMLVIRHNAESRVLIGDPVVLDIEVRNEGDGAAADVMVQVDLPEGLQFSEGFRELEYSVGTLGPGQSKKAQLELRAAKIGKYRNVMVVQGEGGLTAQHAIDLEIIAPQLTASGDGPTRRYLNREATHNFAVRNTGTAQATNVELVCRLPSGLKFVDANNRGQYDEATHAVYWSLAELNSGLVANVDVTTMPIEPGNQDLKLEVNADLEQSTEAICKLSVEHLIDVFFTFDDLVDPIEVGSATAYRLQIENQGTRTATNVQISVQFPAGIQPTAVEGNITSEIRGQQIAFSPITSMNPGDEIEITIRGKGVTPGDHRVSVNLIADGREVNVSKQESTRVYSDR